MPGIKKTPSCRFREGATPELSCMHTLLSCRGSQIILFRSNKRIYGGSWVGTCESFFSFKSNLESNRPYTTQAVTQPNGLQAYRTACYRPIICWRLALWVLVYFNSVIKRLKQCCSTYAYFTSKVDFKRKFNHHQSFLYEWRLTARTIRKFRIGPSIRIECWIGRTIRNRIESRSFAGPYGREWQPRPIHATLLFTTLHFSPNSWRHHT